MYGTAMATTAWPFFDLTVTTPLLTLRVPREDELLELAERSVGRVLAPEQAMFMGAWTQRPSPQFEREFVQFHWGLRASWSPTKWELGLGVFPADASAVVGAIGVMANDFAVLRSIATGSWLLPEARGRGLGREMRAAVLELAFDGLGAIECRSSAHPDNAASLAVSRGLGYLQDGTEMTLVGEGVAMQAVRMRLSREEWTHREDVTIDGLDACRQLFGV